MIKKYDNIINTFTINEEFENTLFRLYNNTLLNDMTINHFSIIAAPLIKAFIKVRIAEDLTYLKDYDTTKKVEFSDSGTADETFLIVFL